jgi:RDD family
MSADQPLGFRAGFWRRFLAFFVDSILVTVPFQLIAAVLFSLTSGWIQHSGSGGVAHTVCREAKTPPDGLEPPPPARANFARQCDVFFFGSQTASILQVGRITKDEATTTVVSQYYMLDRDGHPISGVSIDAIALVVFIAYLLAMETRTGATLGKRLMRICVADVKLPGGLGVPLRKIVLRYVVLLIGFLPMIGLVAGYFVYLGGVLKQVAASSIFTWLWATWLLSGAWFAFLLVQIVRQRDPLCDRVAGTAVLCR